MSATTLTNTLNNLQSTLKNNASNISNAKAVGAFTVESVSQSRSTSGLGGGATVYQRNNFILKGEVTNTGISSDLAIGGRGTTGLFVVKRQNGDIAYTANGSIRQGKDGGFYLADGSTMLGWQFDSAGKLPTNTSTTSSLTPLSLKNVSATAIPTTKIGLGIALNAAQTNLKGPGGTMSTASGGVSHTASITQIIDPGNSTLGELHLNDQFSLKSVSAATASVFQYGGIAISKKISATNPMYLKANAGDPLNIVAVAAAATELQSGTGITIAQSGGTAYTFTASSQAGGSANRTFNSLNSLVEAINGTNDLRANIYEGRIYISGADADSGLIFTDYLGSGLKGILGLDNVPTVALDTVGGVLAGKTRFATLDELRKKIDKVDTLASTIGGNNNISFNSSSPLDTLQLGGTALNARSIYRVTAGYTTTGNHANTTQYTSIATIQSNNHGLKVGDYVRLTGTFASSLAAGTYMVREVTDDAFSIGTVAAIAAADIGAPAIAAFTANAPFLAASVPQDGSAQWQKVDGGVALPPIAGTIAVRTDTNTDATQARFTALPLNSITAAYQMAAGDIVYIKNSIAINDGYYRVVACPDTQTISVTIAAGAGVGVNSDLKAGAGAGQVETATLSITKVSSVNGAGATGFDTFPLKTVIGAVGTSDVQINITPALSNVVGGDIIAFRNLATPTVTFDNVTITKDIYYVVKSVDKAAGTILFTADVPNPAPVAGPTGLYIGFQNTATLGGIGGAVPSTLAQAAGTILGTGAYVDCISRELNALGVLIDPGSNPVTQPDLKAPLNATYDPNSANLSFTSGKVTNGVWSQTTTIVDSKGIEHNVTLAFGKISNNKWAVEVYVPENSDGSYDIPVDATKGSQLAAGYITFNGDGTLEKVDSKLETAITFAWNNGSNSSKITFDWGAQDGIGQDGKPADPGVTSRKGENDVRYITNNGKVPGNVNGFTFDEDGTFSATFDNGETISVGKIAIAAFTNFNGLNQKDGFLYESSDSGAVLLKQAGVGGVGEIIVGGVTSSAVDDTGEYMGVIDTTQASAMAVNIAAKINSARDQLVSGLARG